MPIRLTITDDHLLIVTGIRTLLLTVPQIEVIGTFTSGEALLESLVRDEPDVLLLDLQMPGLSGMELAGIIKRNYPAIRILILTGEGTTIQAQYLMQQGCMGFLLKNTTEQGILIEAIEAVYQGDVFIEPSIKEQLLHKALKIQQGDDSTLASISTREKEVLRLISEGLKSREIADKLSVGLRTVETYRKRLLKKLNAKNMAGLIKTAAELKLI